ncbi:RHS repeat-associated core domain-containing protein [Fimbriimonas ginsengisoli]|uniref:RHS repeat-associated core domain-containing protein n=1 Tax=Fimbriimonas ginsengisoli TaxID=1005039 RepID=UPI0003E968A1|nr:RHS repeat-associated core domain-containing protein [Fimbriimonas ginsengisoli]
MALADRYPLLFRALSFFTATTVLTAATASGTHAISLSVGEAVAQYLRNPHGAYTQAPTKPYLGQHPGRDPHGRGGVWTRAALVDAEESAQPLYASTEPAQIPPHSLAVAAEPGTTYPWEGSTNGVNTGNGNKLTKIPLVSWTGRGGMPVEFSLYHNSQTNYEDELGKGWTWSYDIYINNLTGNPVVHWGDGLSIPFTSSDSGGTTTAGGTTGGGGGGTEALAPGAMGETIAPHGPSAWYTTYTAPAGVYDALLHNGDGTWTVTKKTGEKYQFNSAGFCTAIQDRNGNQITLTLNSSNYCTQISDQTGRHISISVSSGKFTSITDPLGRTWSFTRNGSDCLTTVTWPVLDAVTYTDWFTYDTSGRILTHTDRRGKVWTRTYNTDGSIATEVDPLSHTTSYGYTSSATTITDPLSHVATDNYSSGALASSQDESGFSESVTSRDSNHNPLTVVDKRGKTWTRTFDSSGNVLTVTDPLSHVTTYTYNGFSEPLTVTDALSHVTTNTYDANGNLLTSTDPLSHVTVTNTFGTYGLMATTKDALNHTTTLSYDTDGNCTSSTDPLSHVTTIAYDGLSRVTSTTDALSHVESVAYDAWSRPVTYTHADSTAATKSYNAVDQVSAVTDENSHSTNYAYDNAGRLTSVTNAKSEVESYGYDNADRRTTVTNGRGKVSTYTFTNRGEVATLTMPDSAVESWSYDGAGNTTAYTNPLSQSILYTFDDSGRQTGVDYPTGTDTSFGYNNANRRTSMVDSTGTTSWTYDNASRVTGLNTPQGNLTYTYDNANRKATMVDSTGTTTYTFDNADRLTSLVNPQSETTSFTFDNANRTTRQTFSGGQYDDFGYDSRNRQTSVSHKTSGGTVISSESYSYDSGSNLSSKTVDSVTTSYTYDNIDQLLTESRTGYSATYTYDANGNRASKTLGGVTETYTNDDGDKLTSVAVGGTTTKSFGYDTAGRTTSVVTSAGTTTLTYDYESRVTGITYPGSSTNSFTYNGLDTRVGKVDSAGTSTYRRDGVDVTSPVLSDGYATYTPGISERRSSTTTYDLADRLGTVSRQTGTTAITTSTRTYDAFGLVVSSSGSPSGPFGFVGKEGYQEDADSGLKLLGHRYYDASAGRFITRDSAKDGRNWYSYCGNNPTRYADPNGQFFWVVLALVVFISIEGAQAPTSPGGIKSPHDITIQRGQAFEHGLSDPMAVATFAIAVGSLRENDSVDDEPPLYEHEPGLSRPKIAKMHWKARANDPTPEDGFTDSDLERMRHGRGPQRWNDDKGGLETKEISHEPIPYRDGGNTYRERWPQDHARVDPSRHPGY